MAMLRHNELRELLGVYALGMTDAQEEAALRVHLPTCPECRAELIDLREAVGALPLGITPMEPSPALRSRIEAAILAEAPPASAAPAPAPPRAVPAPPGPRPPAKIAARAPSFWASAKPWAAIAAVFLLVSLGMLGWNLRLRQQIAAVPTPEVIALAPGEAAPGAGGEVLYDPAEQVFLVDVHDLPPLPQGEVYQVWLIGAGGPVPVGVFTDSTDQHAIVADRGQYQTVAITNEPGPLGSASPTGEILVSAAL